MSSSAALLPLPPDGAATGWKSRSSTGTSDRGVKPPPPPGGVVAAAEELHGVGDDVDRLALVAGLALLPLAPLQAAVEGDRPALGEEPGAVLALGAPHGDVEVVRLVLPLAGGVVLPAGVARDPQRADGHAARQRSKLRVPRQVPGEHDAVDVGGRHVGLLPSYEVSWVAESRWRPGAIPWSVASWADFLTALLQSSRGRRGAVRSSARSRRAAARRRPRRPTCAGPAGRACPCAA